MLTVVLHRQWLTVRRARGAPRTAQQRRTVRCLRDGALLLHSLSQKDKLFAVHCVGVLHQYDQAVPGVSTLIRSLPDVTDCEGEQVTEGDALKCRHKSVPGLRPSVHSLRQRRAACGSCRSA